MGEMRTLHYPLMRQLEPSFAVGEKTACCQVYDQHGHLIGAPGTVLDTDVAAARVIW